MLSDGVGVFEIKLMGVALLAVGVTSSSNGVESSSPLWRRLTVGVAWLCCADGFGLFSLESDDAAAALFVFLASCC